MTDSVEYRLLGSLEVVAGGSVHDINSARQRVLLTMLLLHANQVVPVDLLIDAMWNDNPPVTAKSQLQTCVSALRRQLSAIGAKSEIATRSVGYLLAIGDDSLDIETFERLVSSGRAAVAGDNAEEAARGPRH